MSLSLIVQLLLMISAPGPRGEDFESKTTAFLVMMIRTGTLDLTQIKLYPTILDRIKADIRNPKWKKQVWNQNPFHQHLDWEHLECK